MSILGENTAQSAACAVSIAPSRALGASDYRQQTEDAANISRTGQAIETSGGSRSGGRPVKPSI